MTNAEPDKLTISIQNYIALDWLKALDLVEAVETEFSKELKAGTQLAALVPRIAHQVSSLKRRQGATNVNHVADDGGSDAPEQQNVMYLGGSNQRGGNWHRRGPRGHTPGPGQRGGRGYQALSLIHI